MRFAACLLAALCAVPVALAQEPLEWSAQRRLTKEDFRGRVPPNVGISSLSWIEIETAWECELGALTATARATFDPTRSWWRGAQGELWRNAAGRGGARANVEARRSVVQLDMQLLEHEQLHFDIAEVMARRIRDRFTHFDEACDEPGGTQPIQQMIAQADRELQEEQARYDRETSHGVNARAQDQWKRKIRALLE